MMRRDPFALYVGRADSASDPEIAWSIERRLGLSVVTVAIDPGASLEHVLAELDARQRAPEFAGVEFLVVNAFLGMPESECRGGARWPALEPVAGYLQLQGDRRASRSPLLSLQIIWELWTRGRVQKPVLVSTADLCLGPSVRLALAQAFGDGLACVMEDWRGRWRGHGHVSQWQASA